MIPGLSEIQIAKLRQCDDSFRWGTSPESWGQGQQVQSAQLVAGNVIAIGNIDGPKIWRVPRVQNIALFAEPSNDDTTQNLMLRWVLSAGIGRGRSSIVFDATRFQQVAISAASVTINLRVDPLVPGAAIVPGTAQINAGFYQADGNTSTSPARFTQYFEVASGAAVDYVVPEGAYSWQVFGNTANVNQVAMIYSAVQETTFIDGYSGDHLLDAHTNGNFIPLVGAPNKIHIHNTSGALVNGFLCYQLEL
jgi:hypothetical protein